MDSYRICLCVNLKKVWGKALGVDEKEIDTMMGGAADLDLTAFKAMMTKLKPVRNRFFCFILHNKLRISLLVHKTLNSIFACPVDVLSQETNLETAMEAFNVFGTDLNTVRLLGTMT